MDSKFSLDDILNEYPSSHDDPSSSDGRPYRPRVSSFDLDDILADTPSVKDKRLSEQTHPPESPKRTEPPKRTEQAEPPKRTEQAEPPKKIEKVEPPKRTEQAEPPKKIEQVEPPKKTERLEPPKKIEKFEPPKRTERLEPPKKTEQVEPPKRTERLEPPKKTEQVEPPKKTERLETPKKKEKSERGKNPGKSDKSESVGIAPQKEKRRKARTLDDSNDPTEKLSIDTKVYDEFTSPDDAPRIAEEIGEIHATLVIRLIVLIVLGVISTYITAACDYGLPLMGINSAVFLGGSYTFVQIALGALSCFVCYSSVLSGFKKLFHRCADSDSLSSVIAIAALLDAVVLGMRDYVLTSGVAHVFMNVAIFSLAFNTVGKLLIMQRVQRNFEVASSLEKRYAVAIVGDETHAAHFTKGVLQEYPVTAIRRELSFPSGFNRHSYSTDISDSFCRLAVPISIGVALLATVLCLILSEERFGVDVFFLAVSVFSLMLSAGACFALPVVVNLRLALLSRLHSRLDSALLSYSAADELSDVNSITLGATQLFPHGSVSLHAIKVFSDTKIDEDIIDAASLSSHAGSVMADMFMDVIDSKAAMLSKVENFHYEDSLGMCGWINNRRILLGNREQMLNHHIEGMLTMAKEQEYATKDKSAVYLAVSGNLAALFLVELRSNRRVANELTRLMSLDVSLTVQTVDSLLTVEKLSSLFDLPEDMIKLLPQRYYEEFDAEAAIHENESPGAVYGGDFGAMSRLITDSRRVRSSSLLGVLIQISASAAAVIICLLVVILGKYNEVNATLMLLFNVLAASISLSVSLIRK